VDLPTRGRLVATAAVAILSVHATYYNAVVVLGALAGAAAVAMRRRAWGTVGALVGTGLAAALSLVPYAAVLSRNREWNVVVRQQVDVPWIGTKLQEAIATAGPLMPLVWIGLLVAGVAACGGLAAGRVGDGARDRDLGLFLLVSLAVAVPVYLGFLVVAAYPTQPWYYLCLLALLGLIVDVALARTCGPRAGWRALRLAAAIVIAVLVAGPMVEACVRRQTNADLVARAVTTRAVPGDFVVVVPWWPGITFARYYRGAVPWTVVPPIEDLSIHRYDLFKRRMAEGDAASPVLDRMAATLRAGHRVWIVSEVELVTEPPSATPPPPAPGRWGWNDAPYVVTWRRQVAFVARQRAASLDFVPIEEPWPVSGYERLFLFVAAGWSEPASGR